MVKKNKRPPKKPARHRRWRDALLALNDIPIEAFCSAIAFQINAVHGEALKEKRRRTWPLLVTSCSRQYLDRLRRAEELPLLCRYFGVNPGEPAELGFLLAILFDIVADWPVLRRRGRKRGTKKWTDDYLLKLLGLLNRLKRAKGFDDDAAAAREFAPLMKMTPQTLRNRIIDARRLAREI